MWQREGARFLFVLCLASGLAACGGDNNNTSSSPTAPTAPAPTLTGSWAGTVDGNLVDGDNAAATLTQTGTAVTGDWSIPMPAPLVAVGAPADISLAGPVTGSVTGTTAELTFSFLEAFASYFGNPDCAIAVSVTSFNQTTMEATWTTNDSCQPPVVDQGTLTFTRQ